MVKFSCLLPKQFAEDVFAQVVFVVASLQSSVKRPFLTKLESALTLTLPHNSSEGVDIEVFVCL